MHVIQDHIIANGGSRSSRHKLTVCLVFRIQKEIWEFYKDDHDRVNFDQIWDKEKTVLEKLKNFMKGSIQNEYDADQVCDVLDGFANTKKIDTNHSPKAAAEVS